MNMPSMPFMYPMNNFVQSPLMFNTDDYNKQLYNHQMNAAHTKAQKTTPKVKIDLGSPKSNKKEGKAKTEHVKPNKSGPKETWVPKSK